MPPTTIPLPLVKAAYLRQGMREVQGWLNPSTALYLSALEVLQRREQIDGDVCEIGVYHGKSFLTLALGLPEDQRAVAVDVFEDQHLNLDQAGRGDRAILESNLAKHRASANVDIIKASSLELDAVGFFKPGRRFRMFSIDGSHTPEVTCNDLQVAEQTVVEQGIVALDDLLNPQWLGVVTGLFSYWAGGGSLVPYGVVPGKLLLATDLEQATVNRELIRRSFGDGMVKRDVPLGVHTVDVIGEVPWIVVDEEGGSDLLPGNHTAVAAVTKRTRTVPIAYLTQLEQRAAERDALIKARQSRPHRRVVRKLKRLARPAVRSGRTRIAALRARRAKRT